MLTRYRPSRLTVALLAFSFGLWLGYLGAVEVARDCLNAPTPEYAMRTCPDWLSMPDPASTTRVTLSDPEHEP
jgi:hypothetical protein